MSWNHRVIRKPDAFLGVIYAVHEVYYDADGKPTSCTVDPVEPMGESLSELKRELATFRRALAKPVLDFEDFSFSAGKKGKRNLPSIPRKSRRRIV